MITEATIEGGESNELCYPYALSSMLAKYLVDIKQ